MRHIAEVGVAVSAVGPPAGAVLVIGLLAGLIAMHHLSAGLLGLHQTVDSISDAGSAATRNRVPTRRQ